MPSNLSIIEGIFTMAAAQNSISYSTTYSTIGDPFKPLPPGDQAERNVQHAENLRAWAISLQAVMLPQTPEVKKAREDQFKQNLNAWYSLVCK
jgi:hypothetical protein